MPSKREDITSTVTPRQYQIGENRLVAYFDNTGRLVFVLDETVNDTKPNALLVIDSDDGRKWDDILVNDWHVDLETVRPKKDNKYQKLDIEYTGLDIYAELLRAYDNDENLSDAVRALAAFRNASVRRSATERLDAARTAADTARDTIERTNATIGELQSRVRELRAKLSQQRKSIGREPTKQSASKILRTEAQIDATTEKLNRAKRRLTNAQRRLVVADDDARAARDILVRVPDENVVVTGHAVTTPQPTDLTITTTEQQIEPKAEQMADEEVKPLFDKDPEILDEEIAFKPIEFGSSPTAAPVQDVAPQFDAPTFAAEDVTEVAPLSFTPPVSPHVHDADNAPQQVPLRDDAPSAAEPVSSPMLDSLKPAATDFAQPATMTERPVADVATPVSPVRPAPVSAPNVRPVSPITGVAPVAVDENNGRSQKPNLMYYIMLVLLIAMSIFTLWLYQQRNGDTVPDLTASVPTVTATTADTAKTESDANAASPFISESDIVAAQQVTVKEPVVEQPSPAPVVAQPEPEPVPVTVSEPEPVDVAPVVEPEPAPVPVTPVVSEPETVAVPTVPTVTPVAEPERVIASEEEVIASKPAYSVSQQEKMFVASPDYDTETVIKYDDVYNDAVADDADTDTNDTPICEDGKAPDVYGCCTGEVYSDMGDGTSAC
ncbi:MAG: hypothetical protein Q4E56_01495, partial [Pseudomonadota bacterium]|nr:hypothetical protein [Pseudomonadota bacterium]